MSEQIEKPADRLAWPAPVLRVGLRWDGKEWSATDLVRVPSMTLPSPDSGDPKKLSGFWVDTIDDGGRVRYRQRISDPLAGMELFDEKGDITRLEHKSHGVDIEVLVPDDVPAAAVRITSHPASREGAKGYTVEIAVDRERVRTPDVQPRDDRDEHHH